MAATNERKITERHLTIFLYAGFLFAFATGVARLFTIYDNSQYFSGWLTLHMVMWRLNPKDFTHPALYYYLNIIENYIAYAVLHHWLRLRNMLEYWATFYVFPNPPILVLGRFHSLCMGLGTAGMMYHTMKRFWGRREAVLAFLLLVSMATFVNFNGYFKYITTNLFFNMLAIHCILAFRESGSSKRFALAVAAVGIAFSSDYPSLSLLVPLLFVMFEKFRTNGAPVAKDIRRFIHISVAVICGIMVILLMLNPYIVLDYGTFKEYFTFHLGLMRGTFGGIPEPTSFIDHFTYLMMMVTPQFLGPFFFGILCVGAIASLRRPKDSATVVLLYVACHIFAMSFFEKQQIRFIFAVAPSMCMLISVYFFRIMGSERFGTRTAAVMKSLLVIFLAIQFACSAMQGVQMLVEKDVRGTLRTWVETHVPDGAVVALEEYNPRLLLSKLAIKERVASAGNIGREGKIMQAADVLSAHMKNARRYYPVLMTDRPYLDTHVMSPEYFQCAGVGWVILNELTAAKYGNATKSYREFLIWLRKQGPPVATFRSGRFSINNGFYSVYQLKSPYAVQDMKSRRQCEEILK